MSVGKRGWRAAVCVAASITVAACSEQPLSVKPLETGGQGGVLGIGTIGNFVWHDQNANGVQDVGEPGIAGVTLTLVGSEETKTATTDANGMYLFEELGADTYTVTVTPPAGYAASPLGAGTPETDSNPNPATVVLTDEIFDDLTIDFGFHVPATGEIGDYVWVDTNADGVQDEIGTGIAGVTVTLTGPGGTQTTTTDANGHYLFTGLGAGCYTVSLSTPTGMAPSPTGAGTPSTDSNGSPAAVCLATSSSIDHTIDFGFFVITNPAIALIKKTNGTDNNTAPGVQVVVGSTVTWTYEVTNTGDVALGNVTVTDDIVGAICVIPSLAAGASHTCSKTGTAIAGQYTNMGTVVGTAPNGSTVTAQDPDNYYGNIPDAGTIGDFVWHDVDADGVQDGSEPGIAGVTVTLNGPGGTQTDVTDSNGGYLFTDLAAGCYTVTVGTPSGMNPSPSLAGGNTSQDSNGSPANVCLATNSSSDLTIDFGFTTPVVVEPKGKIGDWVWKDYNQSGKQDAGDFGLIATVTLTKPDGSTVSQTTTSSGLYLFTGLAAGCYTVAVTVPPVNMAPIPTLAGPNTAVDSNPSPSTVCLATNESEDLTIDFGYYHAPQPTGKIGNRVWKDYNQSGVQDSPDFGLPGATIRLNGPNGLVRTDISDSNGMYLFTGLAAGCYTVTVIDHPDNMAPIAPNQGSNTSIDSNPNPSNVCLATNSSQDLTVDFGYWHAVSKIGDYVWKDLDRDGRQDYGEPGISGVTVTLSGPGGTRTDVTDSNGKYLFSGLAEGCYTVSLTTPSGLMPTTADVGTDEGDDSENSGTQVCVSGTSQNLTIDFGFKTSSSSSGGGTASIGDRVWKDLDRNGYQNSGEYGLDDVTVKLLSCTGSVLRTTTTNSNGLYDFTGLAAGCYKVQFVLPSGYAFTDANAGGYESYDSDAGSGGVTGSINLASGQDLNSIDAGLVHANTAKIAGRVWKDLNENGVQNSGEWDMDDITVKLLNCSGSVLRTTQTNNDGNYSFGSLAAGCYKVQVVRPSYYYEFTTQNAGYNNNVDSDVSSSGYTGSLNLDSGESIDIDAGLRLR